MDVKVKFKKAGKILTSLFLAVAIVLFSSIGRVFVPSSSFAKCCSVISVSNFPSLISLVSEKVTGVIVSTITAQFVGFITFMETMSNKPGVLYDWAISEIQKKLDESYVETYDDIVATIQDLSTPQNWIKITTDNQATAIVPPLVGANGTSYGSFTDYGAYVNGDTSIIYEAFNTLDTSNVNEETLEHYKIRIRELESSKVALTQEIADLGATAKKLEELNREISESIKKIDEAQKREDYKEEQAVKDLLKLQMLQSHIFLEILRNQINQEMVLTSYYNQKLAEDRNKLINDLQVLHTKVEGSWTLKSSGSKPSSGK